MLSNIENSDEVINLLGYWPKFCDAKLSYLSFDNANSDNVTIKVVLFYIDVDKSIGVDISIVFSQVSEVSLNDFLSENVLDELRISEKNFEMNYEIELHSCCGLFGQFSCKKVEIKDVSQHAY